MVIKHAVISAGGFGTRLKPHTDTMPKPMLPIIGKPMLEWHAMQFAKHGVTDVFFTLHYLPDVVKEYFGDGKKFGIKTHYFVEETPLGSAGALKALEPELGNLFYYIYGDTFSLMDYSKMAEAYALKKDPIGMQRMKRTDDYADADVAELDADERFVGIHKKPHGEAKYPNAYRMRGAFILDKKILSYIPENTAFDLAKDVLPKALADGKNFYSYECDDYSKGIDTEEKYKEVEQYLKSQKYA
jgi:NDP-sugar pyrophosphorylase family protein